MRPAGLPWQCLSVWRHIAGRASSVDPVGARGSQIPGGTRKARSINIRISEHDLLAIKRRAGQEGIPYQTLIASVLHRFVTGKLADEDHVRKAMKLLASG